MSVIRFTKMHGAGNDYVFINTLLYPLANPCELAVRLSRYHFGVGSDGLVLIGASTVADADASMRIFNADGSEAEMCGNAARCVGKYLYDSGMTCRTDIRLETRAGIKRLTLNVEGGAVSSVTVDMGTPAFADARQFDSAAHIALGGSLSAAGRQFPGTFVSMGNPHYVTFVDDLAEIDVAKYGSLLERHEVFPEKCNIEFAQVGADGTLRMRVWERGSGITLACGTGACATAVAAAHTQRAGRESVVVMDGGTIAICWDDATNHVLMTGEATEVFNGVIEI